MKTRNLAISLFATLVTMLALTFTCATTSLAAENSNDKAADERLAENNELVAKWKEKYGEEFGWDITPTHDGASLPDEGDMQQERALAVVIDIIREKRGVGIDFFDGHRPFFGFSKDKIWTISLLPEDPFNDWGFFVELNAQDGTEHSYREVAPLDSSKIDSSDAPKG